MKPRHVKCIVKRALVLIFVLTILTLKIIEDRLHRKILDAENEISYMSFVGDNEGYQRAIAVKYRKMLSRLKHVTTRPVLDDELDLTQFYDVRIPFILPELKGAKRDWHNYEAMEADLKRVGLGEHGMPAYISDDTQKDLEKELSMDNGFNALLSDYISLNRSIPDVRKEECHHRQYLADLPITSIVIPFYNEYFSVLLRSVYSIINRTPPELLHEIILVDDYSDRDYLKQRLDDFVGNYFKDLVKVIHLTERQGLIGARLAGARKATGDVLVFFDSHIECNYNWLPPLLEPIAINKRISTCPIIDGILHDTFAYSGGHQEGSRGAFDWNLVYKQVPVLATDSTDNTRPYRNPIMMGGLFAIGREFFWELGGYDEGLDIWGAEQYELSFKIWMCGGLLCDVPCSRVAHIFRGPMKSRPSPRKHSFVAKNQKRLVEVWMDEYAKYVYDYQPETYANVDAGDLTKQMAIRKQLKCKSFKWFLNEIAPDLMENYPLILPPDYASGVIQSLAYPNYCMDTLSAGINSAMGMFGCAANKTHPQYTQSWSLSNYRDIRKPKSDLCLDVHENNKNSSIWMRSCHKSGGNQFWSYDEDNQMIVHGRHRTSCMEAFVDNGKPVVYMNHCDELNPRMKWKFGRINETALNEFWNGLE